MADTKTSLLNELTAPVAADLVVAVDTSAVESKKLLWGTIAWALANDIPDVIGDNSTDNLTDIQAAIDAKNAAGGGVVHLPMDLSGGTYLVSAGVDLTADVRLTMDPGVKLIGSSTSVNANTYVVRMYPGSQINNAKIAINNNTYIGSIVRVDGEDQFNREHQTSMSNVMLEGVADAVKTTVGACRGIHFYCSGDSEYIEYCQFDNLVFSMFQMAIRMEARSGAPGDTINPHINGNQFTNVNIDNCEFGFVSFEHTTDSDVRCNVFNNFQYETTTDSFMALKVEGLKNVFTNACIWDWVNSSQDAAITFVAGKSVDNHIALNNAGIDADYIAGDKDLNSWTMTGRFQGPSRLFTVATVPDATVYPGFQIYVSNGAAGAACMATSNGTIWMRSDTLAEISAT